MIRVIASFLVVAIFALNLQAADKRKIKPEELVECPVSENLRGHENTEWSIAYSFNLTDENKKDLPRVLLVGDSICNGYQGGVCRILDGKMNVSYWISSYCVTSPGYLRLLAFYLDEAKYDVIHFNNGLHSLSTPIADYMKGIKAAFQLIRLKQPQAKLIWAASTPLKEADKTAKAKELNEASLNVITKIGQISINDLFKPMDALDRNEYWTDVFHFKKAAREIQAKQVSKACLSALNLGN
ncbi:MAG: SGNH/GDSL hydrolase family protein [Kiritimatiellae bacterium]|nr:SGNH/GDSL hydrolase family protein [Kiritimatiellia bacterium]